MFTFLKKIALLSPLYKYQISGKSMEPTLPAGDSILVNRVAYLFAKPQQDDIIALHDPRDGKILIKRISKVTGNSYFVQGDNKNSSTDSRVFGMIERGDIVGKVIA